MAAAAKRRHFFPAVREFLSEDDGEDFEAIAVALGLFVSAEGACDENGEEYDDDDGVLELLEHYHIIHGTILAIRESGSVVVSLAETDYYGDGNLPYEQDSSRTAPWSRCTLGRHFRPSSL